MLSEMQCHHHLPVFKWHGVPCIGPYASVNSSSAHPPRDTPGHLQAFYARSRAFVLIISPRGPGIGLPPGIEPFICHDRKGSCIYEQTKQLQRDKFAMNMDVFENQDEEYVADWLRENGLGKLVNIFKGMCDFFIKYVELKAFLYSYTIYNI